MLQHAATQTTLSPDLCCCCNNTLQHTLHSHLISAAAVAAPTQRCMIPLSRVALRVAVRVAVRVALPASP